ncbi:hypothetical protein LTR96_011962 [Exophiala xenobiotica]|nr:hypothetical protein LTR72_012164 [Exophiala xenobiotica]KAK5259399.1 hypothetical protein LTR96_011962 [Exophiala xenobiotica]KAK5280268.1 hypothetical protein LTR14_012272 [Exophiala xenobiotica]KAK5317255.1 hypothetical protein LTR98_011928 [Exophiala xenobiotica]
MWIVSGPQGPFANFPPVIETEINIILSCIEYSEHKNTAPNSSSATDGVSKDKPIIVEVASAAEQAWSDRCDKLVEDSLFKKTSSWIFGANTKRKQSTKFFFPGLKAYVDWCKEVVADDFKDFKH